MTRLQIAALAAFVTLSAKAFAADPQIIISVDANPKATHDKIVRAAEKLCQTAVTHDAFGDFGSREECIDNTVRGARYVKALYETQNSARS